MEDDTQDKFIFRGVIEYEFRQEGKPDTIKLWYSKPYFGIGPAKSMITREKKSYVYGMHGTRTILRTYIECSPIDWKEM